MPKKRKLKVDMELSRGNKGKLHFLIIAFSGSKKAIDIAVDAFKEIAKEDA
jgi:hypothetical protein